MKKRRIPKSKKTDKEILEEGGWTIECESPLEIRHKDGSFATGMTARFVTDVLVEDYKL